MEVLMADAPAKAEPKADEQPLEEPKSIGETAGDYLIPQSSAANMAWQGNEAGFQKHAVETAKGMFPTMAPQLDQGITMKTLVDPYVQIAKQVLGPNAAPDWTDPKWTKALDGGFDPQTKRPAPMSMNQWIAFLKSDPGHDYDHKPQAVAQAKNFANALHRSFGTGQ